MGHILSGDVASRARLVLDHHLLAETLAEIFAMMRATVSVPPPGAKPTTMTTGRVG
jgi:hypothetical protein